MHAECVMTLLPDALLWANNYVQVCLADGDRTRAASQDGDDWALERVTTERVLERLRRRVR